MGAKSTKTVCPWFFCRAVARFTARVVAPAPPLFQFECVDVPLLVAENKQAGAFSAVVTITSEAVIIPG